jgi:hypothetical protein
MGYCHQHDTTIVARTLQPTSSIRA